MPIWQIISWRVPNKVYFYRPIIFLLVLSSTMLFAQSPITESSLKSNLGPSLESPALNRKVLRSYLSDLGPKLGGFGANLGQDSLARKDLEQTETLLNKELKRLIQPFQAIAYVQKWSDRKPQDFSSDFSKRRFTENSRGSKNFKQSPTESPTKISSLGLPSPYTFSYQESLQGYSREESRQDLQNSQQRFPQKSQRPVGLSRSQRPDRETYGIILEAQRNYAEGIQAFRRGDYSLASQIFIENRYTWSGVSDPYYLNWLLKSLLASRQLDRIPEYLKEYQLQEVVLRSRRDPRSAELYYLIGRYYFSIGEMRRSRAIFIDYLDSFKQSYYVPHSYYWIARSLERESYLDEARSVYLLVVSYFSRHYLMKLAKYKAELISLYLLKRQAEEFLRSRGVGLPL